MNFPRNTWGLHALTIDLRTFQDENVVSWVEAICLFLAIRMNRGYQLIELVQLQRCEESNYQLNSLMPFWIKLILFGRNHLSILNNSSHSSSNSFSFFCIFIFYDFCFSLQPCFKLCHHQKFFDWNKRHHYWPDWFEDGRKHICSKRTWSTLHQARYI